MDIVTLKQWTVRFCLRPHILIKSRVIQYHISTVESKDTRPGRKLVLSNFWPGNLRLISGSRWFLPYGMGLTWSVLLRWTSSYWVSLISSRFRLHVCSSYTDLKLLDVKSSIVTDRFSKLVFNYLKGKKLTLIVCSLVEFVVNLSDTYYTWKSSLSATSVSSRP